MKFGTISKRVCTLSLIVLSAAFSADRHAQKSLWNVRRGASLSYVAIGDSTGLGVGASNGHGYVALLFSQLQRLHPQTQLINLSLANATCSEILENVNKPDNGAGAQQLQPALVTIGVGAIDMLRGSPEPQFADCYEKLLAHFAGTGVPIVVTNIPDISSAPRFASLDQAGIRLILENYNVSIEQIAKQHNLYFVDLYRQSRDTLRAHLDFFSFDGMHPSDKGYQFWADAIWPTVEKAIAD